MFRFPYVWSVLILRQKALERFIREIYFKQIRSLRNNANFVSFFFMLCLFRISAFEGEYTHHKDPGIYKCVVCGTPLFK